MTNLISHNELVSQLKCGWTLSALLPSFRAALGDSNKETSEDLSRISTTALSSARYGRLPKDCQLPERLGPNDTPTFIRALGKTQNQFWQDAIKNLGRGGIFSEPSDKFIKDVQKALILVKELVPDTYKAFNETIDYLCFVDAVSFRAASHPHYFGTIFLASQDDPTDIAVSLVHELAHQELFLLNLIDRLVDKQFDYSMIHAPYQGVNRPPIGRLHSAHALYRMCEFEIIFNYPKFDQHKGILKKTSNSFIAGELTLFAQRIISEVY